MLQIVGERREQTRIVYGVVCSKNTAHKKMRRLIHNPKILLLKSSIEYQRVENKFSSLEPQMLQVLTSKFSSLEPQILQVLSGTFSSLEPKILKVLSGTVSSLGP